MKIEKKLSSQVTAVENSVKIKNIEQIDLELNKLNQISILFEEKMQQNKLNEAKGLFIYIKFDNFRN